MKVSPVRVVCWGLGRKRALFSQLSTDGSQSSQAWNVQQCAYSFALHLCHQRSRVCDRFFQSKPRHHLAERRSSRETI